MENFTVLKQELLVHLFTKRESFMISSCLVSRSRGHVIIAWCNINIRGWIGWQQSTLLLSLYYLLFVHDHPLSFRPNFHSRTFSIISLWRQNADRRQCLSQEVFTQSVLFTTELCHLTSNQALFLRFRAIANVWFDLIKTIN